MSHLFFYALKEDILPVLEAVDAPGSIQYVWMGPYPVNLRDAFRDRTEKLKIFRAGSEIPFVEQVTDHRAERMSGYLITAPEAIIAVDRFSPSFGKIEDEVPERLNPNSLTFRPCAFYGTDALLSGQVSSAWPERKFSERFRKAFKKQFTNVRGSWVGPKALEMLKSGMRLTDNAKSPKEFDLALEGP